MDLLKKWFQSDYNIAESYQDNFPSLGAATNSQINATIDTMQQLELSDESTKNKPNEPDGAADAIEEVEKELDHEQILLECFQSAIKFKSKEFKLPIIVSTFMKILQTCW